LGDAGIAKDRHPNNHRKGFDNGHCGIANIHATGVDSHGNFMPEISRIHRELANHEYVIAGGPV
jgi:hypothetical protein